MNALALKSVDRCDCGSHDTVVQETRVNADGSKRRRRRCKRCDARWSTLEVRTTRHTRVASVPTVLVAELQTKMLSLLSTLGEVAVFRDPPSEDERAESASAEVLP